MTFVEDILGGLNNNKEEEEKTNQCLLEIQDLFQECVTKAQKEADFSSNK